MPIYEYACQKCGEHFEVNQKMSDAPLKKHGGDSKCGGKVSKLMSANTFHLKGTGWYKTDYAKPSTAPGASPGKEKASANKAESATEGSKAESSTEGSKAESGAGEKKEKAPKKEAATASKE